MLKEKIGASTQVSPVLPFVGANGQFLIEPIVVLDRLMVKKNNTASVEVLVQWSNTLPIEATWESWAEINVRFPAFEP